MNIKLNQFKPGHLIYPQSVIQTIVIIAQHSQSWLWPLLDYIPGRHIKPHTVTASVLLLKGDSFFNIAGLNMESLKINHQNPYSRTRDFAHFIPHFVLSFQSLCLYYPQCNKTNEWHYCGQFIRLHAACHKRLYAIFSTHAAALHKSCKHTWTTVEY